MKKFIAMLMSVMVIFTASACDGKKMETFGMSVDKLENAYDSEVRKVIDKEPTEMLETMYAVTKLENIPKTATPKLDNGKTANVYELSHDLEDIIGLMGYKIMEESKSKEVFYAEIWVKQEYVTETFIPFWIGLYGSLSIALVDGMTHDKFSNVIDEMYSEAMATGAIEKDQGKYHFEIDVVGNKCRYIITTKEYNDMTK